MEWNYLSTAGLVGAIEQIIFFTDWVCFCLCQPCLLRCISSILKEAVLSLLKISMTMPHSFFSDACERSLGSSLPKLIVTCISFWTSESSFECCRPHGVAVIRVQDQKLLFSCWSAFSIKFCFRLSAGNLIGRTNLLAILRHNLYWFGDCLVLPVGSKLFNPSMACRGSEVRVSLALFSEKSVQHLHLSGLHGPLF